MYGVVSYYLYLRIHLFLALNSQEVDEYVRHNFFFFFIDNLIIGGKEFEP